jgi:predicted dehydrogenase
LAETFTKAKEKPQLGRTGLDRIDIALIGCGGIATDHINGYRNLYTQNLRVLNIKAVFDVYEPSAVDKRNAIAGFQQNPPKIYDDFEKMLREESLDAVDICVPHNLHHKLAPECLENGLHVIIEKPLGITMRAARNIIETAEKRGKVLAVAENWRRTPENRTIAWAIRQGLIGEPRMIMWLDSYWGPHLWGWREDKFAAGGSYMLDNGVHLADLDRFHLGLEASEVYSVNETFEPIKDGVKVTVDDMTMATIRYGKRTYAQWFWTRLAPAKDIQMRLVYGSRGVITDREPYRVPWDRELRIQEGDIVKVKALNVLKAEMMNKITEEEKEKWFPNGITDSFATELYDFYSAIANKKKPEVDGWEAYRDMAVPIGFYESAAIGRPVKIRDIEELRIEEYQKEINEKLDI